MKLRHPARRAGYLQSAAACVVAALIVAGCGSSNSSSSSSAASSTSSAAPAASTSAATTPASGGSSGDIVIGNIGSYSGPEASTIGPGEAVLKAWASEVNSTGGINGHHVKLIALDDALSPTTGLQEAKQLITQDHVVAIVGDTSLVDPVWAPIAQKAGIPVIGGSPFNPTFGTEAGFFPSGTNYVAQLYGTMVLAKHNGPKFAYLFCSESPICAAGVKKVELMAPSLGMTISSATVSATAPNYTAQCQAVKSSGAQSLQVGQAAAVALKIYSACAAQGVTAHPVVGGGIANATWLPAPATQGLSNEEDDFPYFDSSTPATKAYQALLAKYSLGSGGGAGGTYTYVAAKLFEKAVQSLGSSPVTAQSLTAALYNMKGETLGGLAPPLTFNRGKPTAITCYFQDAIQNHKWVDPEGLKTSCAPPALIAKAIAAS